MLKQGEVAARSAPPCDNGDGKDANAFFLYPDDPKDADMYEFCTECYREAMDKHYPGWRGFSA